MLQQVPIKVLYLELELFSLLQVTSAISLN